jgi:hypothetical protein
VTGAGEVVADALGVTPAGATVADGRGLARCDGETAAVAGYVRAGVMFRPAGTPAGPLVPWPLAPPGVVAMTDGACAG